MTGSDRSPMQNIEQQNVRDWLVIMPRYISYSAQLDCFHITCYQHVDIYSKGKFPTWDKIKPIVFKGERKGVQYF